MFDFAICKMWQKSLCAHVNIFIKQALMIYALHNTYILDYFKSLRKAQKNTTDY